MFSQRRETISNVAEPPLRHCRGFATGKSPYWKMDGGWRGGEDWMDVGNGHRKDRIHLRKYTQEWSWLRGRCEVRQRWDRAGIGRKQRGGVPRYGFSDSSAFPSLVFDFPFAELSLTQTFDQSRAPADELGYGPWRCKPQIIPSTRLCDTCTAPCILQLCSPKLIAAPWYILERRVLLQDKDLSECKYRLRYRLL